MKHSILCFVQYIYYVTKNMKSELQRHLTKASTFEWNQEYFRLVIQWTLRNQKISVFGNSHKISEWQSVQKSVEFYEKLSSPKIQIPERSERFPNIPDCPLLTSVERSSPSSLPLSQFIPLQSNMIIIFCTMTPNYFQQHNQNNSNQVIDVHN